MTVRPAIIIRRIGPYHRARLNALRAATEAVLAVEVCRQDETYAWPHEPLPSHIARATLFNRQAEGRTIAALRQRVEAALTTFAPDCVAVPGWAEPAGLMALQWARRRGVPVILMSDSQMHDAPRRRLTEWPKRAVVRCAGAGFAAGPTSRDYLVQLGMAPHTIALGYDAVDNAHFCRGAEAARCTPGVRERLGLPARYVIAVARFVPQKNLLTLVGAYNEARRRGLVEADLVIVGEGPERPALQALEGPGVSICPFADNDRLPALYGLSDGLILPSLVEPWGLVVNEAMAASRPVIVSDRAGAAPALVEDGVNGFVCPPTHEGLMAAMARLARADVEAMGEAAAARIAQWDLDRFVQGFRAAAGIAAARERGRPGRLRHLRRLSGPPLGVMARLVGALS
ncbi:MAG: glycosyltransferase [Pseudomonadota bacterium]